MLDLVIPSRYTAPKWQAYVTPAEKGFSFHNGTMVRSLWELKQALLSLDETLISSHISEGENHIANWVEFVVNDKELATELRKYDHRWGMIVSLERQMMRTLELPHYVAHRWLREAETAFTFVSGEQVRSLKELRQMLEQVSDETVSFHQERVPNDLSVWVGDVIGDYELSELLQEAASRMQMQRFVADHIEMLDEAALEC